MRDFVRSFQGLNKSLNQSLNNSTTSNGNYDVNTMTWLITVPGTW